MNPAPHSGPGSPAPPVPRHAASRQAFSLLLVAVGAGLLVYVGWSYARMYRAQRQLVQQWRHSGQIRTAALSTSDLGLARLSAPSIHLDVVVVEGAGPRQLDIAPGHVRRTALPGDSGNAVISAHRDTFFRHIGELRTGDDLYVERGGRVFDYKVTGRKIVDPEDVSVLRQSKDAELTLITCYPAYFVGPAPKRLIVLSKLVSPGRSRAAKLASETAAGLH